MNSSRSLLAFGLSLALTLTTAACSKDSDNKTPAIPGNSEKVNRSEYPNIAGTIFGGWTIGQPETDNGTTFVKRAYISQNGKLAFSVECKNGKANIFAVAEVSARVNGNSIEILESAENSETVGNSVCTVTVRASTMNFQVDGDTAQASGGTGNNAGTAYLARIKY